MRFDNRRIATTLAAVAAILCACQARSDNTGDSSASVQPAAPAETSRPASPGTAADTAITPADSVVLTTDKTEYRAGEAMTLTLENKSGATYTFNPCTRSLEREANGTWTAVPEDGRICTMEAWLLEPRAKRSGPTELPTPLDPGRYRVLVRMTRESAAGGTSTAVVARSNPVGVR